MVKTMAPSCAFLILLLTAASSAERSSRIKRQTQEVCSEPPAPQNGKFDCTKDTFYLTCDTTCDPGYEFLDKSPPPIQIMCDIFGETWYSGPDVPNCVPVCSSTCQNGGTCDSPDHCACAPGYSGSLCETHEDPCKQPADPRYGSINCQPQGGEMVCTVACAMGFMFDTVPAASYRCSNGVWSPAKDSIPQCVQDFDAVITTSTPGGQVPTGSTVHPVRAAGAMCVAWGQEHYRTFDNKVYTFQGSCTYTLARDSSLNTFTVNVINDRHCQPGGPCKRELDLYLGQSKVELRNSGSGPEVTWNGASLTVPTSREGTVFQQAGRYLTVQSPLGFMIKWDGKESIFFRVTEDLKGKTIGLCGVYDGDPSNDFAMESGNEAATPAAFGQSWKKTTVGEAPCPDAVQQSCSAAVAAHAESRCHALQSDAAFAPCRNAVDVSSYVEACKFDCCGKDSDECTCTSMEAYSRACSDQGVPLHWRRNNRCPVMCNGGKIFQECGSSCEPTCANPKQVCADRTCVDGCFCPPGSVEHEGQCLPADQCPCEGGYSNGQTFKKDCNTCTCAAGTVTCTTRTCSKRCSAIGDPHYLTFDGHRFDFMGNCSYYLMKDQNFDIIVDNIQCGHAEFATCTKSVTIDLNGMTIKMDHNHRLFVNGKEIVELPYQVPGLKVFMVSSLFMQAELGNGVTVLWDGRTRVYVTAPSSMSTVTQGLCGNFDTVETNDQQTPQLIFEPNTNRFGNSWKTQQSCRDVPDVLPPSPCDSNPQRKQQAVDMCNKLKSNVFSACHGVEPVDTYVEDCVYDMCACSQNMADCLCPTLGVYADTCAAKGVKLTWRQQISECMIQCPGGQEYQVCGNPCERTCRNLAQTGDCQASCVEGCNCPDGQALNNQDQCVPSVQCPCLFDGRQFPAGYATLKGAEVCTCVGAQWSCSKITFGDTLKVTLDPLCPEHSVYKDCVTQCPVTCDNMGDPASGNCTQDPALCQGGCQCEAGFVKQGDVCVDRTTCPCNYGGKEYHEGDVISMDCNQCTCHSPTWKCETNACPSTCSAIGDSHYTTFDGKEYQFQGTCDYVLVKSQTGTGSQTGNDTKFQVTTENVACGTSGVTCSKLIQVTVGEAGTPSYYTLDLVRGQSVTPDPGSPFTVREVGEFVYIDTPFGLSIQWDKGTRVYVRLETQHMQHVEGLCGNFNGDRNDDFKGPSGGPPMVRATEFGDSWKLRDYCAPSTQVADTCSSVPQRKPWAQKSCGILASDLFGECHSVVDPAKYMERCVFDTCACNQGGDCECLCTAIAAYAHACANHGFPVKWRTDDLCPLDCDECQTYSACVSPCPKRTCENRLTYNQDCKDVEGLCFEGCDLQPCPPGQVYSSLRDPVTCIPEPLCDTPACKINGKTYREGERIYDAAVCNHDCEICNCRNGVMEHVSYAVCQSLLPTVGRAVRSAGKRVVMPAPLPKQNLANAKPPARSSDCAPGQTYEACSYKCSEACETLRHSAPVCSGGTNACVPGCRDASAQTQCSPGEKRLDVNTCVPQNMCPCLKPDGTSAKPFETWKNPADSCSDCSCQSGAALCTHHDPTCTATPTATPSPGPALHPTESCGWSQWMNVDTPTTSSGDVESLVALSSAFRLCERPISIECRDASTLEAVIGGSGVTCDLTTGLTCNNAAVGGQCGDYEVRVYCPCAVTPVPEGGTTTHAPGVCVSQWSNWINKDTPAGDGDVERMTLEQMTHFCPGGKITGVQCMTVSDVEYFSTGETATCSAEHGFTCRNADNAPTPCSDYKIKYQCTCPPMVGSDQEPTPKPQVPASKSKCGWTAWLNQHAPTPGGETETLTALRDNPAQFCPLEDIVAVECRPVGNQAVSDDIKAAVTCDLRYDGMVCRNADLPHGVTCPDYQLRLLCEPRGQDCTGGSTITGHPLVRLNGRTHPRSNYPDICMENMGMMNGKIRDDMLTASSFRDAAHAPKTARLGGSGSWIPARDDVQQYLQIDLLTPHYVTGLTTQGRLAAVSFVKTYRVLYSDDGVNWSVYREEKGVDKVLEGNKDSVTPVTHFFAQPMQARYVRINPRSWEGRIALRVELHGCFQAYTSGDSNPTSILAAQPKTTSPSKISDECIQWDNWVDTHQPGLLSRDDVEPIETVRAQSSACAADPLVIQCRTASPEHTPWALSGQHVRCDLWTGLLCNARDVDGPSCFNFQVRLGCLKQTAQCLSQIPTGTHTATPGAQPVPTCYPDVDRTSCPAACPAGQFCDGARCVPRSECPCQMDGKIVRARDLATNGQCETCQCLNGEIRCVPKTCTSCPKGFPQLNRTSCSCECVMCHADEFQCSTGSCIPQSSKCNGVINCQDDELDCMNPPKFAPPTVVPTAIPDATPDVKSVHRRSVAAPPMPHDDCPKKCPAPEDVSCPATAQVVGVLGECNCTKLACLAKPLPGSTLSPSKLCHYQKNGEAEVTYQIGETWTNGVCEDCACVAGIDGSGEVSCQRQKCAHCKMGERSVEIAGECCGRCQAEGCLLNSTLFKAGETMPSQHGCYSKTCQQQTDGSFMIREVQTACQDIDTLRPCVDDTQRYDDQGCCLVCKPTTMLKTN